MQISHWVINLQWLNQGYTSAPLDTSTAFVIRQGNLSPQKQKLDPSMLHTISVTMRKSYLAVSPLVMLKLNCRLGTASLMFYWPLMLVAQIYFHQGLQNGYQLHYELQNADLQVVHNSVYEVSLKKNLKLIKFRSNYQFIGNKGKNKLSSTMMMQLTKVRIQESLQDPKNKKTKKQRVGCRGRNE